MRPTNATMLKQSNYSITSRPCLSEWLCAKDRRSDPSKRRKWHTCLCTLANPLGISGRHSRGFETRRRPYRILSVRTTTTFLGGSNIKAEEIPIIFWEEWVCVHQYPPSTRLIRTAYNCCCNETRAACYTYGTLFSSSLVQPIEAFCAQCFPHRCSLPWIPARGPTKIFQPPWRKGDRQDCVIKCSLSSPTSLVLPKIKDYSKLRTDGCDKQLRCVLQQEQKNRGNYLYGLLPQALNDEELAFASMGRACLAVVWIVTPCDCTLKESTLRSERSMERSRYTRTVSQLILSNSPPQPSEILQLLLANIAQK